MATEPPSARARHLGPALGLWFLAPVTAEYLYGYDESTGNLAELAGGLTVLAPLYGGAALVVRELARRTGCGWPAMLLLGLGFGVLQAGLIDHSMFNPSYRDIDYWDAMFDAGLVPALGLNPNLALVFATGHMVWSVAVPIAVVEALAGRHGRTPWLGDVGLAATAAGFVLAAVFVLWWHLDQEDFVPSAGQVAGASAVVLALGVAASRVTGRRPAAGGRPGPGPWTAGLVALTLMALPTVVALALERIDVRNALWRHAEASWFLLGWPGFAVNLAVLAALGVFLARWARGAGWGPRHELAVAGGALLANVTTAFAAEPIGDVSGTAKYAHNGLGLLGVITLLALAARSAGRHPLRACSAQRAAADPSNGGSRRTTRS